MMVKLPFLGPCIQECKRLAVPAGLGTSIQVQCDLLGLPALESRKCIVEKVRDI